MGVSPTTAFLCRAFPDQIADHHQAGGDPDARLQLDGFDIEATHPVDAGEAGADRPLGVVLMRLRVAEINQHTIAHVFRDKAAEAPDGIGDGAVVGGDDLAIILGIEARGEFGRPDQVAEHHRQLPTLGRRGRCWRLRRWMDCPVQLCNRFEQLAPMTHSCHADILQIITR